MRLLIPLAVAIPAVLALFLAMSAMIQSQGRPASTEALAPIGVDLVRPPAAPEPIRPPRPEPPEAPPQSPMEAAQAVAEPWKPPPAFTLRPDPAGWERAGLVRGIGDRGAFPLIEPTGLYPRRARREGVEGYVLLRFTVLPGGGTTDIEIIEAHPSGYFEAHAISSIQRSRFRPAVRDGEAVSEVIYRRMDYTLDDED
jgi:periplasmic protein TonB